METILTQQLPCLHSNNNNKNNKINNKSFSYPVPNVGNANVMQAAVTIPETVSLNGPMQYWNTGRGNAFPDCWIKFETSRSWLTF